MALAAAGAAAADANRPTTAPGRGIPESGMDLTRLLLDRPAVPVTPPKDVAKPAEPADTPVEGSMIVDRPCRLVGEPKSHWLILSFPHEPALRDEPPRRALPCRLLEQMEAIAADTPGAMFRISGETTVYEDRGYLLLTKATVLAEPPAPPRQAEPAPPASLPAAEPASRPAAGAPEPSSNDILNELLSENVGRPVNVGPLAPQAVASPSVAPVTRQVLPPGRGTMVVDRLVRIVLEPDWAWWSARFEADNTLQEPPMRLLPCGMLARAVAMQSDRTLSRGVVFRVSGLVTHYKGQRYLLLRKLLIERDLGRF